MLALRISGIGAIVLLLLAGLASAVPYVSVGDVTLSNLTLRGPVVDAEDLGVYEEYIECSNSDNRIINQCGGNNYRIDACIQHMYCECGVGITTDFDFGAGPSCGKDDMIHGCETEKYGGGCSCTKKLISTANKRDLVGDDESVADSLVLRANSTVLRATTSSGGRVTTCTATAAGVVLSPGMGSALMMGMIVVLAVLVM